MDEDTRALLRLIACRGPLAARLRMLEEAGSPSAALLAGAATWRACGLPTEAIMALRADTPADPATRAWLDRPGHRLLGWHDPDYPPLLRQLTQPPLALFVAGEPTRLWHPSIAIVGSRQATPGGLDHAAAFARALALRGWAVASGLAAGVDAAAHAACLDAGGLTAAVVGTGPDIAYPRRNAALHARILAATPDRGVLVSEHLPGTAPHRSHFPRRNRLLAGLSLGTLVVEAAERSGALITARLAAEAGREVFALPGALGNPMARGCHRLIREGATLVRDAGDIIETLAPLAERLAGDLQARLAGPTSEGRTHALRPAPSPGTAPPSVDLALPRDSPDHNNLWQALGHDPSDMDQLVERSGLTAAQVSSMLLHMELDGHVTSRHGRYSRRH
ncbi:DNA-protecting protein DprA [Lysobacter sp. SG-8]|uniref:DNA-protecting protein DprA n=1 Tax=Marilutibacter penaei TaxID=2759900 RepID=A0A7W3U2L8_9GAMM|nr:DNA-processing protein DprA [Lysobacter penaei]MBB1087744.1 DNA-protecting protein DprA [Lysobacter penaei]